MSDTTISLNVQLKGAEQLEQARNKADAIARKLDKIAPKTNEFLKEIREMADVYEEIFDKSNKNVRRTIEDAQNTANAVEELAKEVQTAAEAARAQPTDQKLADNFSKLSARLAETQKLAKASLFLDKKQFRLAKQDLDYRRKLKDQIRARAGQDSLRTGLAPITSLMRGDVGQALSGALEYGKVKRAQKLSFDYAEAERLGDTAGMKKAEDAMSGGTAQFMSKFGTTMAAVAGGIGGLIGLLGMASERATELNKALVEGTTFAGDLGKSGKEYSKTIDDLVSRSIDFGRANMRLGVDGKELSSIIKSTMNETTTSIAKARDELDSMEGGAEKFGQDMILYGRALGMSSQEMAVKTASLSREYGMSMDNAKRSLGSLVNVAKDGNLPISKIVNIFDVASADVSAYNSNMGELLGTIQSLSKSMSASSIKDFISAFKGGYMQAGSQTRLKAAVIGGQAVTQNVRQGIISRMDAILSQTPGVGGIDIDALKKATREGNSEAFYEVMSRIEGHLNTTQQQALRDQFETFRRMQGGGALATMSGMQTMSPNQYLETLLLTFSKIAGKGEMTGINEYVASAVDISDSQREAILKLQNLTNQYLADVKAGRQIKDDKVTRVLESVVRGRLGKDEILNADTMRKYINTEDILRAVTASADLNQSMESTELAMKRLSEEQNLKLKSIGDILKNSVAFMLEQTFTMLNKVMMPLGRWVMKKLGDPGELRVSSIETAADARMAQIQSGDPMQTWGGERSVQEIEYIRGVLKKVMDQKDPAKSAQLFKETFQSLDYLEDNSGTASAIKEVLEENISPQGYLAGTPEIAASNIYEALKKGNFDVLADLDRFGGLEQQKEAIAALSDLLMQLRLTEDAKSKATGTATPYSKERPTEQNIPTAGGFGPLDPNYKPPPPARGPRLLPAAPARPAEPAPALPVVGKAAEAVTATALSTSLVAGTVAPAGLQVVINGSSTEFQKHMAEAVKKGVDQPLAQTALTLIRANTDPAYASALAGLDAGFISGLSSLAQTTADITNFEKTRPGAADGGTVLASGNAVIHRGEEVVTARNIEMLRGLLKSAKYGVLSGSVVVNVNVAQSGATGEEIAGIVRSTLVDIYTREARA